MENKISGSLNPANTNYSQTGLSIKMDEYIVAEVNAGRPRLFFYPVQPKIKSGVLLLNFPG